MKSKIARRKFLATAGAAALAVPWLRGAEDQKKTLKILGIACSPRQGLTTATAVQCALEAAAKVNPCIRTELLDLGGKNIAGWSGPSAKPTEAPVVNDDFNAMLPALKDPQLAGLIIGSPVYFRTMSALCKAFLERCAVLRGSKMLLADKAVGVLAVGGFRNGGQELVIEQIQAIMLCYEAVIVGGKPSAHQGATLWNNYNDDIMKDEFGIDTARKLGTRVAEAALKLAPL